MTIRSLLSLTAVLLLFIGCTSNHHCNSCGVPHNKHYEVRTCSQHLQSDLRSSHSHPHAHHQAPGIILQPFRFTGQTLFDTDKAILRTEGKRVLDKLSAELSIAKKNGLVSDKNKVVIMGHTDSRASQAYNQSLSVRRANAVATYLKNKDIPTMAMLAIGYGELTPVASNKTSVGRQLNRRVEIHIEGPAIRVVNH